MKIGEEDADTLRTPIAQVSPGSDDRDHTYAR